MRAHVLALLGAASASAVAFTACGGGTGEVATTTGSGGAGGGTTTTSTMSTTSTSTPIDAGPDVDNGMVSTTYPAPHPAAPSLVTIGGPVLASPKLVPVFFANESPSTQASLTDFVNQVGGTMYFAAATAEYGVGPATALPAVVLAESAPAQIDDADIQTWLAGKLNAGDPLWPAADANTLYLLHYPTGTGITQQTQSGVEVSCQSFGGYHSSTQLDGAHGNLPVAYAVIPRCHDFFPVSAPGTPQVHLTGLAATTATESHEIVEAVTDPYPLMDPAYVQPDGAHLYWALVSGGEDGDMCESFPRVFTKFAEMPYTVQRAWSNAAAAAGKDPCVPPLPGEVYFNSAPVLKDFVKVPGIGTVKGAKVPVGQTKVVEIDLFSEADPGGPWDVDVQELGQGSTMDLSLDRSSGQNGEKLHLTITVNAKSPQGFAMFQITSSLGQTQSLWYGIVGYQ